MEVHTNLFWHYPHYHGGSGMLPGGAIRSGNWKLIEWYEKSLLGEAESAFELYDLESDIGETRDLSDSLKTRTAEMARALQKWRIEVGAQMPVPNKTNTEK
jgi:arylsulfatase A